MPRPLKTYLFNGKELTMPELRAALPFCGDSSIHKHLAAGRNTTKAVTEHRPPPRPKPTPGSYMTFSKNAAPHRKASNSR